MWASDKHPPYRSSLLFVPCLLPLPCSCLFSCHDGWSLSSSAYVFGHLFVSFTSFLSKGVSGLENMLQTGDAVQSLCSIPKTEAVGTLQGKRHHCEPEQKELAAVAFVQMQLRVLWLTFCPVGSELCICEEWRSHLSGYRK